MDKAEQSHNNAGMRVLHIDDEPMICDVTRLCLEREGKFKVDYVHSPEEALALIRERSYACIISDYEMPSMNGIELLKEIRSFDSDIPFILFSGRGRETVVIEAINTGADFYIQKGGDTKSLFAELNHKVDYAISKRNARVSLKRRDAILEAVSLVATMFLGGESFENALSESLTLFGLATEVDSVLVFRQDRQSGDQDRYTCISSWSRLGENTEDNLKDFVYECPDQAMETIHSGSPVIGSAQKFSSYFTASFEPCPIKSLAVFPVIADRDVRGMIWFCDSLTERKWAPIEVDALQAAASIIGSALHHDELRSELIERKERYESMYAMMRQLCDIVPDMLWAKDGEGRYIFVNKETSDTLLRCGSTDIPVHRREDEFIQMQECSDLPAGCWVEADVSDSTNPRSEVSRSLKLVVSGNNTRYIAFSNLPLYGQNGEPIGTIAVGHDLTSERRRDEEMRIEREKYALLFHHAQTGLISCLPEGEIADINKRAATLIGLDCTQVKGLLLHELPFFRDPEVIRDFSRSQISGRSVHGQKRCNDISENAVFHYCITPYLDDASTVREILITIDDHILI